MPEKLGYAVIGTAGDAAKVTAALALGTTTELVALAAPADDAKATQLAKQYLAGKLSTREDVWANPAVAVVYVASTNQQHFADAKAALLHGKHVIVERPLTPHKVGASELFALANQQHRLLVEAQPGVCLPLLSQIKDQLAAGVIGQVRYAEVKGYYALADQDTNFLDLAQAGGALHLGGSYPLQVMPYLLDEPITAWSGHCLNANGEADTAATLSFKTKSTLVNCLLATGAAGSSKLTLVGTKGKITVPEYWHATKAVITTAAGTTELTASEPKVNATEYLLAHVATCLANGLTTSPMITPQATIKAVSVIEELYQSWYGDPLN